MEKFKHINRPRTFINNTMTKYVCSLEIYYVIFLLSFFFVLFEINAVKLRHFAATKLRCLMNLCILYVSWNIQHRWLDINAVRTSYTIKWHNAEMAWAHLLLTLRYCVDCRVKKKYTFLILYMSLVRHWPVVRAYLRISYMYIWSFHKKKNNTMYGDSNHFMRLSVVILITFYDVRRTHLTLK